MYRTPPNYPSYVQRIVLRSIFHLEEQFLLTNYKCIIHVQFSQFYGQNCGQEFLEWQESLTQDISHDI